MAWTKTDLKRSYPCNSELFTFLSERRGWAQLELATAAGYSERLISKAEAGKSISPDAINDLADALSQGDDRIYPEDLISDPVKMAQDYIAGLYIHQKEIVNAIRHFLDDDITIRLPGDPQVIPFAGEHRKLAGNGAAGECLHNVSTSTGADGQNGAQSDSDRQNGQPKKKRRNPRESKGLGVSRQPVAQGGKNRQKVEAAGIEPAVQYALHPRKQGVLCVSKGAGSGLAAVRLSV